MNDMKHFIFHRNSHAINYAMVLKVLGQLLIIEAGFMALPLTVSLLSHEHDSMAFAIAIVLTLLTGLSFNFFSRPENRILKRRDGMLLASMVWIVFSLFGMLPFILCETPLNVSEAFFEAMSGFTTTGATVIREVERCSKGILIWRSLTQWIGGLGIILFTLTFTSNWRKHINKSFLKILKCFCEIFIYYFIFR